MGNLKVQIAKIRGVLRSDFIKVSSWSAVGTAVKMATGFVSIKIISTIIGPTGIAIVGQFLNSITMISSLATGGVGQGVTKYIAEYYDRPEMQKNVIVQASRITLVFTILMSLLVILFSSQLSNYVLKSTKYHSLIILFGISLLLYSFNLLFISILNGFKAFKKFIVVNVVSSLLALALALVLVTKFGLYGALINCVASQSLIIIVSLFFLYKEPWFSSIFSKKSIDWNVVKNLGRFTLMSLTSSIINPFTQLSIRTAISSHISLKDAGFWEAMNRLSSMYLMLFTTSISIYYLPRLAEIKEQSMLRYEIVKTSKIVLPIMGMVLLLIYVSRDLLIPTLFSQEFTPMRDLFLFQLLGDYFKIASFLIAFLFWAKGMAKVFIISEVSFSMIIIILVKLGLDKFGLIGSVYAYALAYLIYLIVVIIIFRRLIF